MVNSSGHGSRDPRVPLIGEMIDQRRRSAGLTFEEALGAVRDAWSASGEDLSSVFEVLEAERKSRIRRPADFQDITTADQEDIEASGWYEGPDAYISEGLWSALKDRMEGSGLRDAVRGIDASSTEVVKRLAEPGQRGDKRIGVVVGNVQSGKTANYAAVISKAVDAGYRFVIVLSGIHNNLRLQTQARLERDLGVAEGGSWISLTDDHEDGDIKEDRKKNAAATLVRQPRVLAVVKKNSKRLDNLLKYLEKVDEATMARTPILVIDDESDQATPDSSSEASESPSAINQKLRKIWGRVLNGSYVGYTATPFANFFMNPNDDSSWNGLPELYPRNFLHVMPTPDSYFGAERIFGITAEDPETEESAPGCDVVRRIDDAELKHLRPRNSKHVDDFQPCVTSSLEKAVRWFIVASAVRRLRGQRKSHSSMLIHTTHYAEPHFAMQEAVERFLEPLRERSMDGDVESFRKIFREERDRAAHLYTGEHGAVTWQDLEPEIMEVLRRVRVVVDNGSEKAERRLAYSTEPQTVIVIGGGTLSRGLTLEGLFVSYFTRTSNAYDTLLQMGRWFGYRVGYEDLQRIWVSDGLEEDYRFLARVELEMRQEISIMIAAGEKPKDIGVKIRHHPGRLEITSRNKMRHTDVVETDFEGYRLQTYIFPAANEEAMVWNLRLTEDLLRSIAGSASGAGQDVVYRDVPFSRVDEFLDAFTVHPHFHDVHGKAREWVGSKLPEVPWNVVVASGSRKGTALEGTPSPVRPVNRAPFSSGTVEGGDGALNIRALMTGDDMILDLKRLKVSPRASGGSGLKLQEMRAARRKEGGGRGLLILYPISRNSEVSAASADAGVREPMAEALQRIGGASPVGPEDEGNPIIGYSLVLPYDLEGRLERRGQFIAVTPDTMVAERESEELPGTGDSQQEEGRLG